MYMQIFNYNYVYNYTHTYTFFILWIEFHDVRIQTKFYVGCPHRVTH